LLERVDGTFQVRARREHSHQLSRRITRDSDVIRELTLQLILSSLDRLYPLAYAKHRLVEARHLFFHEVIAARAQWRREFAISQQSEVPLVANHRPSNAVRVADSA
jgi:hypothetical protein